MWVSPSIVYDEACFRVSLKHVSLWAENGNSG